MAIGNFGKLVTFEVSSNRILTFNSMQVTGEARWKEHDRVNMTPKMEYLGRGLYTVEMTITLDARHGVSPRSTLSYIRSYLASGKPEYLVIKGSNFLVNKFVITKTTETWDEVWNNGELVRATISVELKEYV